jgi:hypothetical protein
VFNRRLFLSVILFAMPASADLLQVAVSGTFGSTVPTTALTGSGATWVLTFDVDSQAATGSAGNAVAEPPSNLTYVLNNSPVPGVTFNESALVFQDTAHGGGLGVIIATSDFSAVVDFIAVGSQQLFSDVSSLNILTGAFDAADFTIQVGADVPDLLQTASILITDLSTVPEPHSNLLLGTVFVMAGSAFLFKRRRGSAAPRERSQG